jgi:hypothetical protein
MIHVKWKKWMEISDLVCLSIYDLFNDSVVMSYFIVWNGNGINISKMAF